MRELLEQDGREIEVAVQRDVVAVEAIERAQEGEVRFGRGLEQPLDAVRPAAVVDDVGQMGVQRNSEESTRLGRWLCHRSQFLGAAGLLACTGRRAG